MPITDGRKSYIEKWMIEMIEKDLTEKEIEKEMNTWSKEDRAYFHFITDNYEPDELQEQVERGF